MQHWKRYILFLSGFYVQTKQPSQLCTTDSLRFMERRFKVSSKTWTLLGKSNKLLVATRVSTTFCLEKQETGKAIAVRVVFHQHNNFLLARSYHPLEEHYIRLGLYCGMTVIRFHKSYWLPWVPLSHPSEFCVCI